MVIAAQPIAKITIPVDGMTGAACQAHVQKALSGAPGVQRAAVNLMANEATIVYDPARATPQALVDAVTATGYESRLPAVQSESGAEDEARERAHAAESRELVTKAGVSLAAGAVAMMVSMPLMTAGAHRAHSSDPVTAWTMRVIDPPLRRALPIAFAIGADRLRYGLLVMTLFVMLWAGRHFYTRAWAALRHGNADMNTLTAVGTGAAFLYSLAATLTPQLLVVRGRNPTSTTSSAFRSRRERSTPRSGYCSTRCWRARPWHSARSAS